MQRSPIGRHSPALMEDEDVIRRRKLAAEKRVQERHRALLAEQKLKNRSTAEERQRLLAEMREREAKEMKKRQEELHRHLEWLERDKARKKEILTRQHAATSRTAAKPGIGFGSSTPRELSYLNNLPKSQQTYDKKLSPPPEPRVFAPKLQPTPSPKKTPSMMTTSMYVPSSTPRRPPTATKTTTQVPKPKTPNLMTQSFYTPSPRGPVMTSSTPRARAAHKPTTPTAKPRLPPATPKAKKIPPKSTIVEEVPEKIKEQERPTEPKKTEEEIISELASSPLEEIVETAPSSDENVVPVVESVEEVPAVIEQPVLDNGGNESLIDFEPMEMAETPIRSLKEELHQEVPSLIEQPPTIVEQTPPEPEDHVEEKEPPLHIEPETPLIQHEIPIEPAHIEPVQEHATNLFDELAAINIAPIPLINEVIELDYSSDPHLNGVHDIAQNNEEKHEVHEKIQEIQMNGHHEIIHSLQEEFTLPGGVSENREETHIEIVNEVDLSPSEKPESIEESKLITSRPPSPPVATRNEELEEISRRREDDQKHNAEIKARFAAVKARIGRISPPNVNGSPAGLPPPAPPVQPVAAPPVENGKPLSDSTAALLQRLSKMGALKSTKAAESVDALLTRHSSDPKIDLAPDDPVSLI